MKILAPVDGSDCSMRALRFAAEFARRYDATLHAVHITDVSTEGTKDLLEEVRNVIEEEGLDDDPEVVTDVRMSDVRYANRVGKDILELVEEEGYDHVVMGHHGTSRIGRAVLGSAAETVVRAAETPATIIP